MSSKGLTITMLLWRMGQWACAARAVSLPMAVLLVLLLSSCQRDPLELYYDGRADLHLTYDWLSRFGERPDGMTLMMARNGDSISYYDVTYRVDETSMRMQSGHYLLTVMNRSFGEYGSMRFFNRSSYDQLMAVANTYNITAETAWDNGRAYMEEPERIGVATDTLHVSTVIDSLVFYDYRDNRFGDTIHHDRLLVVRPMTTTLNIRVKVRGISYMRSLDGYIMGMADGFFVNQAWRRSEVGSIKLSHWTRVKPGETRAEDAGENVGWMTTQVETFGLPHGRELLRWRTPESNYIQLHFTLIDGRTVNFGYPVGRMIRYRGDEGDMASFNKTDIALELDLVIDAPFYGDDEVPILPYSQPEGSGLFDAEVADWGDDVDVEVPLFP